MEQFCSRLLLQSSQAPIPSKIQFKRKLLLCFQVQSANHWKLCIFPPIRLRMWNFVHFPFSVQFFAQPSARRDSELKVKMFSIANSNFKNYSENERLHTALKSQLYMMKSEAQSSCFRWLSTTYVSLLISQNNLIPNYWPLCTCKLCVTTYYARQHTTAAIIFTMLVLPDDNNSWLDTRP